MSEKRPICNYSGRNQELQAGDTLPTSHDAVTLAANAEPVLEIAGQAIGLDGQLANRVFSGPTYDPAADVSTLLHLNGANESITITDEKGLTWLVGGNAKLTTTDPKFGTACLTLDGNGDYVYSSANSVFNLGLLDFRIDVWVQFDDTGGQRVLFEQKMSGNNARTVLDLYGGSFRLQTVNSSDGVLHNLSFAAGTISTGTWYQITLSRVNNVFYMFKDGTMLGSGQSSTYDFPAYTGDFYLGYEAVWGAALDGQMDEFRILRNSGVSANFTADTSEFAAASTAIPTFRVLVPADVPNHHAQQHALDSTDDHSVGSLAASLPVFTDATPKLITKSVADTLAALGLTRVCFKANKNATNQDLTTGENTKVTFTNELLDAGGYYDAANSRWTPPAGTYRISFGIRIGTNMGLGVTVSGSIYKNGAPEQTFTNVCAGNYAQSTGNNVLVQANGTDYFEAYTYADGTGNKIISGATNLSWFCGEAI